MKVYELMQELEKMPAGEEVGWKEFELMRTRKSTKQQLRDYLLENASEVKGNEEILKSCIYVGTIYVNNTRTHSMNFEKDSEYVFAESAGFFDVYRKPCRITVKLDGEGA